jgi:hypothetical protein
LPQTFQKLKSIPVRQTDVDHRCTEGLTGVQGGQEGNTIFVAGSVKAANGEGLVQNIQKNGIVFDKSNARITGHADVSQEARRV